METILVTPENVVEVVLIPRRFSACPSLRRLCTEAFVLSQSRDRGRMASLAAEAFGTLSERVVHEIESTVGVKLVVSRRAYGRTMVMRRRVSDLVGIQIDAAAGFRSFSSICIWRNDGEVSTLFAN